MELLLINWYRGPLCVRDRFFFRVFNKGREAWRTQDLLRLLDFFQRKNAELHFLHRNFDATSPGRWNSFPGSLQERHAKKTGDFGKHLEIGIYAILNPRLPRCHSSNPEVGACPRHRFFTSRAASSSPRVQQTPLATPLREAPMAQQQQACSELK